MSAKKIYSHNCSMCNKETPHLSVLSGPVRIAVHVLKVTVFAISFGMAYPHIVAGDGDGFAVQCTECHTKSTISYG